MRLGRGRNESGWVEITENARVVGNMKESRTKNHQQRFCKLNHGERKEWGTKKVFRKCERELTESQLDTGREPCIQKWRAIQFCNHESGNKNEFTKDKTAFHYARADS
jgi:phage gp37-like protein